MNLLIVGGLFGLAVVAIIGTVLLVIGEQRREATHALETATQPPLPVEQHPAVVPQVTASSRPTVPLDRPTTLLPREENPARITLNGQFHELADEIRELHQHAWDLEQRLSTLTDMVDRIERLQNGHTSIEEELPSI